MTHQKQPDSNGLAIASLILGILSITSFSILTGIPAVITGLMGLKNPMYRGMSIAGIITGGISIVLAVLTVLVFLLFFIIAVMSASTADRYDDTTAPLDTDSYQRRT